MERVVVVKLYADDVNCILVVWLRLMILIWSCKLTWINYANGQMNGNFRYHIRNVTC